MIATLDGLLLGLQLLIPLIGALLVWGFPDYRHARLAMLATLLANLALALLLVARFDPAQPGFQFVAQGPWIPTLNAEFLIGVDGISLLFVPLTNLLFLGVLLAVWNRVRDSARLGYSLLLVLLTATLGVYVALDTLLFFLFWELTLIPLYFLVSLWGLGPDRRYAAVKYVMFMLVGGVPLLFGFLLLALHAPGAEGPVFDYRVLLENPPPRGQWVIFVLLLIGFGVKTPLVPFHTWLPTIAMEGPAGIAAILAGLKLGAYGLVRFTLPLVPDAARELHWLLAGLGVVGILYGAVIALTQTNLRRMLAYSSVSHVGFVVLALSAFNMQGIQGALFQLYNFALIAGGLFLLSGAIHHRIGSTDSVALGGIASAMPLLASAFFFLGLASIGVPGTNGFIGEHLILLGTLKTHTGAGLAALFGVVLGAAYFLNLYRRAFLGPVTQVAVADALDLRPRERLLAGLFCLLALLAGLWPDGVLELTRAAGEEWVGHLGTGG